MDTLNELERDTSQLVEDALQAARLENTEIRRLLSSRTSASLLLEIEELRVAIMETINEHISLNKKIEQLQLNLSDAEARAETSEFRALELEEELELAELQLQQKCDLISRLRSGDIVEDDEINF